MRVTVEAQRSLRVVSLKLPANIRFGHVGITLAISLIAFVLLLNVPPFMASGADLSDASQRAYASNIWQENQTSLALLGLVLPWLLYGILWPGTRWGRWALLAVSTAAVAFTTWLVVLSAQSYTALPTEVTGVVDKLDGRSITLTGPFHAGAPYSRPSHAGAAYYLVLSDRELRDDGVWLKPGTSVLLWVSPRGHAGGVTRVVLGD
jgi:hypothetical protein